jgi:hypothetical protein
VITRAIATAAKAGSTVTVNIFGVETTVNVLRDVTVAAGDGVYVDVKPTGDWWVIGRTGTTTITLPTEVQPEPPIAKPVVTSGASTFSPVQTASRQGTRWRDDNDDVYQGEYSGNGNHVGVFFYGSSINSLAGVTVTKVIMRIRRLNKGGAASAQALTLRLVTEKKRPSGAVTLGSTTSGPSLRWGQTVGDFVLPNSWGQALVDGTAGGIAVYVAGGSPYVILAGRGSYSAAGTLRISYFR